MKTLANKVTIITGGGSGIGKASALLFAKEGAKVVVCDWDVRNGKEAVNAIKEKGGEGMFVKTDVSEEDDVKRMVTETLGVYGKIDILFNNAGIEKAGTVTDLSEEEWDKVFGINVNGIFLCSKYVVPEIMKRGGGTIINTASGLGIIGGREVASYAASKGAVITLTKCMARDYAPKIRVNCICPGAIDTPMLRRFTTKEELEMIKGEAELKRLGAPEEVASLVLFLASDASSLMTGSVITIGLIA